MKCLLLLLMLLNSFAQSSGLLWIDADVQTNYKLSFFFLVIYNVFPEQLYTMYRQAASLSVGAVADYTHVTLYIQKNYCIWTYTWTEPHKWTLFLMLLVPPRFWRPLVLKGAV